MRWSLHAYIAVFAFTAGLVGLGYRAIDRGLSSLACHQTTPDHHFLAYCGSSQFGDYEHGAYYYNLEPTAVEHLKRAEVIFFGSSRAQIALSTQALREFFAGQSIAPYVLGFGYNEQGAFPLAIVEKHRLKPKALVILADPFFQNRSAPLVRVTQWVRWRVVTEFYEFTQKKLLIAIGSRICGAWPNQCVPAPPLVFRSQDDGLWHFNEFDNRNSFPVGGDARLTIAADMAQADRNFAERFIAATRVPRDCIILSAAPNNSVRSAGYVVEMGRLLGVTVSLPELDNLATSDGSHLLPDSAERWSAALLADVRDTLTRCARR